MPLPRTERAERILAIDGLRAVAVLGVIWAHVWAFSGTPSLSFGFVGGVQLDLNRALSAGGTGVDLFFVISGFCMYLVYARQEVFSWGGYAVFLKKRWLRIAPAFYVAAFSAALGTWIAGYGFPTVKLAANLAFLHIWVPDTVLVAPFWSLATEWHFYLLLPLLVLGTARWGFAPTIGLAAILSLAVRAWIYASSAEIQAVWDTQLPNRFIEFAWGIWVARLYALGRQPPAILTGSAGFVLGAGIAYAGRVLMVSQVVQFAGPYGVLLKILSLPVLTFGCALMLWNVVSGPSWFARVLSSRPLRIVGRWSFSLYLWHWWPAWWISGALAARYGSSAVVQHTALALCLIVLLPVAALSYRLLELPYFRQRKLAARVLVPAL